MMIALRLAVALMGGLFVFVGFGFLTDPATSGSDFGIAAEGTRGLSTIRADLTSFFFVSGGAFLLGAWKKNGTLLLVTGALMGIVLVVRTVSLALDGPYDGWFVPMTIEALAVILALAGAKLLPERA